VIVAVCLVVAAVFAVLMPDSRSVPETVGDPLYKADGSNVLWFMQISDTHITTFFNEEYDERLEWVLSEGVETVDPWFICNTGDLTDGTDGVVYGTGPHLDEWSEYRDIVISSNLGPEFYFDMPGNHDAYGDLNTTFYQQFGISGQAFNTTQPHWLLRFGHGSYHFVTLATPANDGRQWWSDNKTFTQEEQDEVEAHLSMVGITNFAMMFGHHDVEEVDNTNYMIAKMHRYGAKHYAHGHAHDLRMHVNDETGIIRYRIDSLGQRGQNNVAIYAIDNNTVSMTTFNPFDPWPVFVMTAPGPSQFISDQDETIDVPYIPPVPKSCEAAPVRILAFDTTEISIVRARIDGGEWFQLVGHETIPHQWRGSFDATGLDEGTHYMNVEVTGTATHSKTFNFTVEEGECDIGEEDDPAPLDEGEMIVFYPDVDGDEDSPAEEETEVEPEEEVEPEPICTPGEKHCQETVLLICADDGMQWDLLENCGEQGTTCQDGACLEVDGDEDTVDQESLCTPGEKRCDDTFIEICSPDGGHWDVYTDCAPKTCQDGTCVEIDGDVEDTTEGGETTEPKDPPASSDDGCAGGSSMMFALLAGIMMVLRRRRR